MQKFGARSHVIRITVGFCHGNYYPQKYEKSHLLSCGKSALLLRAHSRSMCYAGFVLDLTQICIFAMVFCRLCVRSLLQFFSFFFLFGMCNHGRCCNKIPFRYDLLLRANVLVVVPVFATMEFQTQSNEIGSGHKKWAKLNYSLISSKPNTLSK